MRPVFVRSVLRLVTIAVPTAVAFGLAACRSVTGPGESPRAAARDSASIAQRATHLGDTAAAKCCVQPWY
ncbi:hypothetical protein J421_6321 (plasmid) [Gemmatirosa kalamazoonensis]|uniref:Lipoprotein n=1 Tax=Gemmatirosa kalamazoonensis TaxID=861299 RepID=W0RT39_9BACT|nr:hypothetical protein [Gemmatirosa kalamazoonensis]AHG93856.1 hypothetical protein J421_6321 [Gemmatirosa kalamazoonensis]